MLPNSISNNKCCYFKLFCFIKLSRNPRASSGIYDGCGIHFFFESLIQIFFLASDKYGNVATLHMHTLTLIALPVHSRSLENKKNKIWRPLKYLMNLKKKTPQNSSGLAVFRKLDKT